MRTKETGFMAMSIIAFLNVFCDSVDRNCITALDQRFYFYFFLGYILSPERDPQYEDGHNTRIHGDENSSKMSSARAIAADYDVS